MSNRDRNEPTSFLETDLSWRRAARFVVALTPVLAVLVVLVGSAAIGVSRFLVYRHRRAINEAATSTRTLALAELTFRARTGRFGHIDALREAGLVSSEWSEGTERFGRVFASTVGREGDGFGITATSRSDSYDSEGFFIDETLVLRHVGSGTPNSDGEPYRIAEAN